MTLRANQFDALANLRHCPTTKVCPCLIFPTQGNLFQSVADYYHLSSLNLSAERFTVAMEYNTLQSDDYLQQYRNISAKLKKRFLRKPNVAEAADEFECLQRTLADSEVFAGAGLCCVAAARCHQTLANGRAEVDAITRAARYYIQAEQASTSILCPSEGDNLQTASSCYRRAIGLHGGDGPVPAAADEADEATPADLDGQPTVDRLTAAALSLELAGHLESCARCSEALPALLSSADLLVGNPVQLLLVLDRLQRCYVMLGDLDGAMQTADRALTALDQQRDSDGTTLPANFRDQSDRFEVSGLLLLLLLQPLPQKTAPRLQQVLDKYSVTTGSYATHAEAPFSEPDLLCLLQSLSLAVTARDMSTVQELSIPLSSLLHHLPIHLHLLHTIVIDVNRG